MHKPKLFSKCVRPPVFYAPIISTHHITPIIGTVVMLYIPLNVRAGTAKHRKRLELYGIGYPAPAPLSD
ncbi:hypothetical protein GYMLUDRAFT_49026, partial [Collybiopsis luxurians FD-317 M1]